MVGAVTTLLGSVVHDGLFDAVHETDQITRKRSAIAVGWSRSWEPKSSLPINWNVESNHVMQQFEHTEDNAGQRKTLVTLNRELSPLWAWAPTNTRSLSTVARITNNATLHPTVVPNGGCCTILPKTRQLRVYQWNIICMTFLRSILFHNTPAYFLH